jgi:hypothetical protein
MQPKLITNFDQYNQPTFLARVQTIDTSLTGNTNFALPWDAGVPTPANIHTAVLAYEPLYAAATGGDAGKITARNNARAALTIMLQTVAPYLEKVANGNVAVLQTTGYELRHDSNVTVAPEHLSAPTGFNVVRGEAGGTLMVGCDKLVGAGSYIIQTTTGDPTVDANFGNPVVTKHCQHNLLTGQVSGSKVSVRMCGVGKNGPDHDLRGVRV